MAASSPIFRTNPDEVASLSDREALRRMIQYARTEAEREGALECAELLAAALLALDHAVSEAPLPAVFEPRRLSN